MFLNAFLTWLEIAIAVSISTTHDISWLHISPSRCPACPPCTSSSGWASRGTSLETRKRPPMVLTIHYPPPPTKKNPTSILKIYDIYIYIWTNKKKDVGWLSQNHFCPSHLESVPSSTPGGAVHHQKVPWLFQELLLDPSRAAKSEPLRGVMGGSWGHGEGLPVFPSKR